MTPPRMNSIDTWHGLEPSEVDSGRAREHPRARELYARIRSSTAPIVWIVGIAGTGKSLLLASLQRLARRDARTRWTFLDAPAPEQLAAHLAGGEDGAARRVIVASRPLEAAAGPLLRRVMYGEVLRIDERELFLSAEACAAEDPELYRLTGGWPMLVQAWRTRRARQVADVLPQFLASEVLPALPPPVALALLAGVSEPLPEALCDQLCEGLEPRHPLLACTEEGIEPAGEWLAAALRAVLARADLLPQSQRTALVHLHSTYGRPQRAIGALIALGRREEARRLFEDSGGVFFGFRHGFEALERVLEAFGADVGPRHESLFLARLFLLFKNGQTRETMRLLEMHYPRLPVDLRDMRASHRTHALLLRLDIAADFDEVIPAEVIASWTRLEAHLAPDEHWARGILYNTMTIGFLRIDELALAERFAAEALRAYELARSPYLTYFMRLHLADIALKQSRLRDAGTLLEAAEQLLAQCPFAHRADRAMLEVFRARLAYEQGRLEDIPERMDAVLEVLTRGDSWPGLIRSILEFAPLVALWRQGLRAALETSEWCLLTLSRRHGPSDRHGSALVRVRICQVARRHAEAARHLAQIESEPAGGSRRLAAEGALIRLRAQLHEGADLEAAESLGRSVEALPSLEPRQRIACAILQAELRRRRRDPHGARRLLLPALRAAQAEGLLGVLIEEAEFLERQLPPWLARASPGEEAVRSFARRVADTLRALPATGLRSRAIAGVSAQELRVLLHLSDGLTNKQIARALEISESTVKFHLRSLFGKLKARGRVGLLERARAVGLVP